MSAPPDQDILLLARRHVNALRKRWQRHSPATPLYLMDELAPGVVVADFCVEFLISHRLRRQAGTKLSETMDSAEYEEDEEMTPKHPDGPDFP